MLGAVGERHLAAEPPHGLGHLDAHRPAAEHQQAARDLLHAGHLAVGPDAAEVAQPLDRRHDRGGAVRDDDVLGGVARAVDLDHAGPGEAAAAAEQVDAVIGEPALLAGVRPVRRHEVAPPERRVDVDLRGSRRVARALNRLARAQQRLRRDTRPIRALAADKLALHDRDAQAALGKRAGAMLARRAAAEHDHVVVALHDVEIVAIWVRSRSSATGRARGVTGRAPWSTQLSGRCAAADQGAGQGVHGRHGSAEGRQSWRCQRPIER